jgi:23S rRNA (uracil1939-C5)-methyltransferase
MSTFTLDVEGLEPSGDGAAYGTVDRRRVRLDFALPGERVEADVVSGRGGALTGEVVRVVARSPHRVQPLCPYFGACGGCMWQHIAYSEQLRIKERLLREMLERAVGGQAPPVATMLTGSDEPWGHRNKVHFVFGRGPGGELTLGHYRRQSTTIVPVEECPVHEPRGNRVAFALRDALRRARVGPARPRGGERHRPGVARHVVVRATLRPPETLATLVVTRNDRGLRPAARALGESPDAPDGLHLNIHDGPGPYLFGRETRTLRGRDRVRETIAGTSFLISPTAFFQTNVRAADKMVRLVLGQAGPARQVLDLYAGAGLFALPLARAGVRVTAVEESREAVEDGEASRRFNRIAEGRCRFVRARAEEVAARGGVQIASPLDLVVLDPPRSGCPKPVLAWVSGALRPARIVYVSCNPETLAADLKIPLAAGYLPRLMQPIDMFPHTPHVETVAVLVRGA